MTGLTNNRAHDTPQGYGADACATRYPLLIVHGVGFHDRPSNYYWGRIPAALRSHGARVFFGYQDAWGTFEDNARQIAAALDDALAQTGSEKANVIAHSKGGIDARYLISSLGADSKVASLTTLSSPHRGSKALAGLLRARPAFRLIAPVVDGVFRATGDASPDFLTVCTALTPRSMEAFNRENPDRPNVHYQHFAAVMSSALSNVPLSLPYLLIKAWEGDNDGIVALSSTHYGCADNFKGVLSTPVRRGVSHDDIVDSRRRPLLRKSQLRKGDPPHGQPGAATAPYIMVNDIPDFYVGLVAALKAGGY